MSENKTEEARCLAEVIIKILSNILCIPFILRFPNDVIFYTLRLGHTRERICNGGQTGKNVQNLVIW